MAISLSSRGSSYSRAIEAELTALFRRYAKKDIFFMMKRKASEESTAIRVTRGSSNVFKDLGLPNPGERLAKAQFASLIDDVIRERRLTQRDAAALMGIDQPKVSHLLRGSLTGLSTQRLTGFLTALGRDVEITVRAAPKSRKCGRLRVTA
jgi:predicted XRE-type DNA-binding protein